MSALHFLSRTASRQLAAGALICLALSTGAREADAQSYFYSGGISRTVAGTRLFYDSYLRETPGQMGVFSYTFPPLYISSELMRATSGSGPGYLTASTFAQMIKTTINDGPFNTTVGGSALAKVQWTDVGFNGPPGTLPARLRVRLTGRITAGSSLKVSAFANVQVVFFINGQNSGGAHTINVINGAVTVNQTGALIGFDGDQVIVSSPVNVQANTPIAVEVQLSVASSTSINYSDSGDGSSNTDFSGTLTLVTDQPVFDVPAGYTVNSAQAGIVGNWFTIPCPADLLHDTVVDDLDFSVFAVAYDILDCADPEMKPGCAADLNHDGVVDDLDFSIFAVAYNNLLCD